MKKNKNLLIGIVVALLVLMGIGVYIVSSKKAPAQTPAETVIEEEVVETISPADLGLTFTARPDKKAVKFALANAKDISLVEYQISYTKEISGEQVPETLIGDAKPDASGNIAIDYRELGTCSAKVCRYDVVVSDIKLTLKVVKANKTYQSETSLSL